MPTSDEPLVEHVPEPHVRPKEPRNIIDVLVAQALDNIECGRPDVAAALGLIARTASDIAGEWGTGRDG